MARLYLALLLADEPFLSRAEALARAGLAKQAYDEARRLLEAHGVIRSAGGVVYIPSRPTRDDSRQAGMETLPQGDGETIPQGEIIPRDEETPRQAAVRADRARDRLAQRQAIIREYRRLFDRDLPDEEALALLRGADQVAEDALDALELARARGAAGPAAYARSILKREREERAPTFTESSDGLLEVTPEMRRSWDEAERKARALIAKDPVKYANLKRSLEDA